MSLTPRLSAAAAALLLLAPGAAHAQAKKEVIIGISSPSIAVSSGRVAKELGLFEKRGSDARFIILDSSAAAITALIAGSYNFIVSGVPEMVVASAHGQRVVAITNTYVGFATSMVLSTATAEKLAKQGVTPSSPIEQRLKALNGVLLATPSATAIGSVVFKNAVQANGGTIRNTYMAQPAMPAALETAAIEGFYSSAPFWAAPVVKGTGVLWINGPRGDLPAQFTPRITSQLQSRADYVKANPDVVRSVAGAFEDLGTAIKERPADVKAAFGRVYPDLDTKTLDLLFAAEAVAWDAHAATVQDMTREVGFIKSTGLPVPNIDSVDAAALVAAP